MEKGGVETGDLGLTKDNPTKGALQLRANLALNFNVRQQKHCMITTWYI